MSKILNDNDICKIINKKTSLNFIKNNHPKHYKALQLGAFCLKHNINDLEQLKILIDINNRLLNK